MKNLETNKSNTKINGIFALPTVTFEIYDGIRNIVSINKKFHIFCNLDKFAYMIVYENKYTNTAILLSTPTYTEKESNFIQTIVIN